MALAAVINSSDIAQLLLDAGADTEATETVGFCTACVAVASAGACITPPTPLLERPSPPPPAHAQNGWTPLMVAANASFAGVVRVLLAAEADTEAATPVRADVAAGGPSGRAAALPCRGRGLPTPRALTRPAFRDLSTPPHSQTGLTPLMLAASDGCTDVVQLLLNAGADKHAQSVVRWARHGCLDRLAACMTRWGMRGGDGRRPLSALFGCASGCTSLSVLA